MGCFTVSVSQIVVVEESMWVVVMGTLRGISCFKVLHVFYATLKDHNNPMRGDPEGSDPSYVIKLGFI